MSNISIMMYRSNKNLSRLCNNVMSYAKFKYFYNHCIRRSFYYSTKLSSSCPTNLLEIVNNKELRSKTIKEGPSLQEFINSKNETENDIVIENIPYLKHIWGNNQKVYFKIYGCQMNNSDAEVVWSILKKNGYERTDIEEKADIILLVTCAIRDKAEQKIWNKLEHLTAIKNKRKHKHKTYKIGLLGCMAKRLKDQIIKKNIGVDVIAGPDSYKDLPRLLAITDGETGVNVMLSFDETYADILPVRLNSDSVTAYVSIMRGCDNMCSYCIVPFTRGRERSRPIESILDEVQRLSDSGVKEVTLLGQNVNSYRDLSQSNFSLQSKESTNLARGFKTVYKNKIGGIRFSDLLDKVSLVNPNMRIRFTSPHPKDFPDEVLHLISERPNICNQIHVPAQSGNSDVLERMRRGYTREAYLDLISHIREIIPDISLSSDFIAGFCGETEAQFQDTLSLIDKVKYNVAFLYAYSMREKTTAHRRYKDDVPQSDKLDRLQRMIQLYRTHAEVLNKQKVGKLQLVLVEGVSRKDDKILQGRNDGNIQVLFPHGSVPQNSSSEQLKEIKTGDYVCVKIYNSNSQTLSGIPMYHSSPVDFSLASSLTDFGKFEKVKFSQ